MSKKLIAVAAAAALALTALVGTAPANANVSARYDLVNNAGTDVQVNLGTTLATSAAGTTAALLDVPSNDSLQYSSTTGRASLLKVTVTVAASGTKVDVATTGKVRVIDEATTTTNKYTSASGLTTWSTTSTSTSVIFYAYTTATVDGSLKITTGGNSTEVFFYGKPGPAYKLSMTVPSVVGTTAPADANVFASVVDAFGNNVEDATITTGVAPTGATLGTLAWNADNSRYESKLHNATVGTFAVTGSIPAATKVTAFGDPVSTYFGTVNSADPATQIATLTAQVASLQTALAGTVTKAKYNNLVKKYNKITKGKKAKLVK
jgi:hypothetical protein